MYQHIFVLYGQATVVTRVIEGVTTETVLDLYSTGWYYSTVSGTSGTCTRILYIYSCSRYVP